MLRAMLRDLFGHRARVAMTLVAIASGVAFVVASWVVSDSLAKTLSSGDARGDVGVVARGSGDEPEFTPADRDRLGELPGVVSSTAVVSGRAGLVSADGKLVPIGHDRAATNWDDTGRFVLREGRAPQNAGEVAVGRDQLRTAQVQLGQQARVLLPDGREDHPVVVGTFDYRPLGQREEGPAENVPAVAYDQATAVQLFGDRFTRIELGTAPGTDPAAAKTAAGQLLGDRAEVLTGADVVAESQRAANTTAQNTLAQLLPFAAVALLVASFVIANTFGLLVTQRTRQFALLRAVGAHRGQVRRSVVVEATALALAGGTLGALLGVGLGLVAFRALQPDDAVQYSVPPIGIVAGYAAAIVVTVLAASGAARRAASVPPLAALRMDAVLPPAALRRRTTAGLGCLFIGAGAIIATSDTALSTAERVIGMAGAVLCALAVILLAPKLALLVLRPVAAWTDRRASQPVRLGVRNAARDPRRSSATATTLMVSLGLVCAFATLSASLTSLATSSIKVNIPATTAILQPAAGGAATLAPGVLDEVRSLPGITDVMASRDSFAEIRHAGGASKRIVSAIDPEGVGTVLTPKITAGTAELSSGAIVAQNEANLLKIGPGDDIEVVLDDGTAVPTRVAGVYEATEAQASIFLDEALVSPRLRDHINSIYAGGPDPAAAEAALRTAFENRPDIAITDRDGLVEQRVETFRYALLVMYAMFAVAVVIAVFGVVNTLGLSVIERTREIGMLRAVGASRQLVRRMLRVEGVVISLYGGVLGLVVGIGVGTVMQHTMLGQELWRVSIPIPAVLLALVGTVVVGVVAAIWPAKRAAGTPILDAIDAQ
ncbi:ABC transporter permease [Saccharopolyspora hirsuta]|uniref:ABC transporter permease n=2 Tax=Saccharopolyspora TaxID=1835 RepID=UPI00332F20D3